MCIQNISNGSHTPRVYLYYIIYLYMYVCIGLLKYIYLYTYLRIGLLKYIYLFVYYLTGSMAHGMRLLMFVYVHIAHCGVAASLVAT